LKITLRVKKPLLTIEQSILIFGIYLLILATIWVIMVREKDYYDENPKEKLELKKSLKAVIVKFEFVMGIVSRFLA
jgi:hypothetical protein